MAARRRRCRNCPDEQQPLSAAQSIADKAAAKVTSSVIDRNVITTEGEGQKLWNHVLFGTGTCIGMMQGYANLGMPGDPLPQLRDMNSMLTEIIKQVEKQNADRNPT